MKKLVMSVVCLAMLSACSHNYLPKATHQESQVTNVKDYNYLVGPNDQLTIFVWQQPDISGSWTVRPDGKITTSLVEDLLVSGKTPTEVARLAEERLGVYIKDPVVTVTVNKFSGPFSEQVRVVGEATNPSAISYSQNMTLLDVMIAVGGLTDYADGNDAKLLRFQNGVQVEFNLLIEDLIKFGESDANVDILPGDVIVIPETWF